MCGSRQTCARILVSTTLTALALTDAFHVAVRSRRRPNSDVWALLPQENPQANPNTLSKGGILYGDVARQLNVLYPAEKLDERNAKSRTDGYWPFVSKGDEPPEEFTYGEFDFYFFANLLEKALEYAVGTESYQDKVFTDIGSGTGRLVLAASMLHPQARSCRGVELLQGISNDAMRINDDYSNAHDRLQQSPVEFICGSFDDPYTYFGDSDIVFCFSSCLGESLLKSLAESVGRQCRPGTVVITTEFMLPLEGTSPPVEKDPRVLHGAYKLKMVEKIDGWCWLTGGDSTAYIHVVESSAASPKLDPRIVSLEDQALDVVKALESGELTDTEAFLRNVRNDMVYHGIADSFPPKPNNE